MKYLRLRYADEDDVEYDRIVIFEKDYDEQKIEDAMRELWNKKKSVNLELWLMAKGLKVEDIVVLNNIELQYIN